MPLIHSKEKLEENKRYDITYLEYRLRNWQGLSGFNNTDKISKHFSKLLFKLNKNLHDTMKLTPMMSLARFTIAKTMVGKCEI
jgi:hypothetical protein